MIERERERGNRGIQFGARIQNTLTMEIIVINYQNKCGLQH